MCSSDLTPRVLFFEQMFGYPYFCTARTIPDSAHRLFLNCQWPSLEHRTIGADYTPTLASSLKGSYMAKEKPDTTASDKQSNERAKALDTALAQIERQFGKGSVMKMGERTIQPLEVIPTGSIALDIALGIGGLPREIGRAHV